MGLLPLEFTDCLQDSPYFRSVLSDEIDHVVSVEEKMKKGKEKRRKITLKKGERP